MSILSVRLWQSALWSLYKISFLVSLLPLAGIIKLVYIAYLLHSPISCKFRFSQKTFYTRTIGNYIEMQTNLQLKPDDVFCTLLHIFELFWAALA